MLRELPRLPDPGARFLALHGEDPAFYPAFLDSAATGNPLGRFSLLLADPGASLVLDREGGLRGPGAGERFCARLNAWWREESKATAAQDTAHARQ